MIRNIIIVEDDKSCAEKLASFVTRFFNSVSQPLSLKIFNSSLEALEKRTGYEDLYFLDIDLPHLNGMDLAKKIREKDEKVVIVFCSNLAQFALKGYEVGAFDYIVKPFDYSNIAHRLSRALNINLHRQSEKVILKVASSENVVVDLDSIIYIEKERNYLVFHTSKGDYWVRGSLQEYEKILPKELFSYSKKGVYVNLSYVEKTIGDAIVVSNKELPLARQRKKEFIKDLFGFFDRKEGN